MHLIINCFLYFCTYFCLFYRPAQIQQILRVSRGTELHMFRNELDNIKPLLHSTASSSLVGILSRWESLLFPASHTCINDTQNISEILNFGWVFFPQWPVTAQGWSRAAWDWKNRHWQLGKWHLLQWLIKVSVFQCFVCYCANYKRRNGIVIRVCSVFQHVCQVFQTQCDWWMSPPAGVWCGSGPV